MAFSVIIPSRDAGNLVPCIKAIREAGETCRIIAVDDGALADPHFRFPVEYDDINPIAPKCGSVVIFDGDSGRIKYDHLQVVSAPVGDLIYWVRGEQPFIFARNVNLGIQSAGDDDVIILNDDALLQTPQGFSKLQEAIHDPWKTTGSLPGFGIVASTCNNVGNENQWQRSSGARSDGPREDPRMVCFVCVYIPRSTINAVGLLDERFVDYGCEDDDYCFRVRAAGLKVGIFDGCYVDHGSLKSSFRAGPQASGDFKPNLRRFIEKWGHDNRGLGREESPWKNLFPKEAA